MKNRFIWLSLSLLLVATLLLASCSTSTTSTSTSTTTTKTTTSTATTTKQPTTTAATTTATTTSVSGNWWDALGIPTYGGTMTFRDPSNVTNWDPATSPGTNNITDLFMDHLTGDIWTEDPATFNYQLSWRPPDFVTGHLAASYEYSGPSTFVVHLRHGVHWQNLPPANGRELIASDVVANYQRIYGAGAGPASPSYASYTQWQKLQSVTADGNYTVIFQWGTSNTEFINELMMSATTSNSIQCPDAVKQWGNLSDWHHAIGTGAFMVTDFVSGSSVTLTRNDNYFEYDERYPNNQLPYLSEVQVLIMPEDATALAAMRSGKMDIMYGMKQSQAQQMAKTNPEILQIPVVGQQADCIMPRSDKAPFNNIKVREALQMSISLADIASNYYGGNCSPNPSSITNMNMTGWGLAYPDWPQELKDEYAYNVPGAKALLTAAGYASGFTTDVVASTAYDSDLLLLVQNYFAAINVTMNIRNMDKPSWTNYVRVTHSHDALSYGSTNLGLCFEPSVQMGVLVTGNSSNVEMVSDPTIDGIYAKSVAATSLADFKQDLVDMNLYVAQQHYSISLTCPNTVAFCQPWLKGYSGQAFAADFAAGAPMYGAFYLAHFWVDSALRKSLGK